MASPPAKRQRRLAVLSSDDEEADTQESGRRSKLRAQRTINLSQNLQNKTEPPKPLSTSRSNAPSKASIRLSRKSSTKTTPNSSPEKARSKTSTPTKAGDSKSLHSFFKAATEEERWSRQPDSGTGQKGDVEVVEDLIEDDPSDEAFLSIPNVGTQDDTVLDRRKKPSKPALQDSAGWNASQKFLKPAKPVKQLVRGNTNGGEVADAGQRPWADQFAPTSIDELAVHKKKVADVQRWLIDSLAGRDRHRLLVLKGPAGSGKSTTISLLADLLGLNIMEWRNPIGSEYSTQGSASVAAHFEEFLARSGDFAALDFADAYFDDQDVNHSLRDAQKRIIMVEEFPNTFTRSSSAIQAFRSTLLRFVAANSVSSTQLFGQGAQSSDRKPPMVMLVSETLLTSSTAATDSFTAHRLLGPEISNHPSVTVIEFNPIAPSYVMKALELVLKKEARTSKRRRIPGPGVLKRLSEMGDIRSAIGSLEFLCLRGDDGNDWSGRTAAKMKKADKGGLALTQMEKESLELVTQREASLGMFHAVGKVVYNKRQEPTSLHPNLAPLPPPPDHLEHLSKPKVSEVSVEDLIDETGTDTDTFLSALHENYVLSCDGANFIDHFADCADYLSESDVLNSDTRRNLQRSRARMGAWGTGFQGGGVESLRRDEICFQVAVRGLLFSLPYPVKRASRPGGGRSDAFKMFYPTSSRLWKPIEEVDGYIDVWMNHLRRNSEYQSGRARPAGKAEGVESWKGKDFVHSKGPDEPSEEGTARAMVSREDVLLERLPYQAKITTDKSMIRDLARITQFHGTDLESEEAPDDDATLEAMDTAAYGEVKSKLWSPRKRDRVRGQASKARGLAATGSDLPVEKDVKVEKLVLSDDDIEDE